MKAFTFARPRGLRLALGAAAALGISGCTSLATGDRIDYRTAAASKTAGLDVPPDLTQLTRDSRFQPAGGTVSASTYQAAAPAAVQQAPAVAGVALASAGNVRFEKAGSQRFLVADIPPETLWPQLRAFWQERGFTLVTDEPQTGIMETQWAENRAKLPLGTVRSAIGRAFGTLYSTSERDKFRTRVERAPGGGSEIYISHRGMVEVYSDTQKTQTVWQPRPSDPQLEAELLSRLMLKLGAKEEQAKAVVATAAAPATAATDTTPVRARIIEDGAAPALRLDDDFDRAWRRVGLALDRSGFTVEDRDRSLGQYFVRYVDPARAGRAEPGFFSRLFRRGADAGAGPARYRVNVKSEGGSSIVTVLDSRGAPESGEAARRIVRLLAEELR